MLNIPTAEEIFDGPRPPRGPHSDIVEAESERSEIGRIVMEVADRECARLLVNTCLYDPPITDLEIQYYANCNSLGFTNAQAELRRLRNDT